MDHLTQLQTQLIQAQRAFKQRPTPALATVIKQLQGAIRYASNDGKVYHIVLKHTDGSLSYLSIGNRSSWAKRTARKHLKDVALSIVFNPEFAHIRHASLQLS